MTDPQTFLEFIEKGVWRLYSKISESDFRAEMTFKGLGLRVWGCRACSDLVGLLSVSSCIYLQSLLSRLKDTRLVRLALLQE